MSAPAGGRYRRLLATPDITAIMATGLVARLPLGIMGLALVLFVRDRTGSYASAGAVAAAYAVGTAVVGPFAGRLVDRVGARAVLLPMAVLNAAGTVTLVLLDATAPVWLLITVAGLAGGALPPVSSVIRTLLSARLHDKAELESTAFALDAVIVEIVFVGGPALVALLNVALTPSAPLWCSAAVVLVGTGAFVARTAAGTPHSGTFSSGSGVFGALRAPGLRTLVLGTLPIGMTLGATEVILPAFSEAEGSRAFGGVLLAIWTAGSVAGGLAYGAMSLRSALGDRFVVLATLLPLTLVPLLLAPSVLVMALLLLPAGAIIAPTLATVNQLISSVTPPTGRTEAYTWPLTALVLGIAAGNLGAGAMVELSGWSAGFVAAIGVGVGGSLLLWTQRTTLQPLAG